MVFDDAQGVGRYRDNVHLTREDATLTADAMDAYLTDRAGSRELDRILASGSVAVKRDQAFGTARTAEYRAADDLLVLQDGEGLARWWMPRPAGPCGQDVDIRSGGDRILTESARGARTWITLKPEAKDVQSVEPKTKH